MKKPRYEWWPYSHSESKDDTVFLIGQITERSKEGVPVRGNAMLQCDTAQEARKLLAVLLQCKSARLVH